MKEDNAVISHDLAHSQQSRFNTKSSCETENYYFPEKRTITQIS